VKHWELIADNLSKAGWSWGCVSAIDSAGRTIWIADAHRDLSLAVQKTEVEGVNEFWAPARETAIAFCAPSKLVDRQNCIDTSRSLREGVAKYFGTFAV
jgi:hypothetical protein